MDEWKRMFIFFLLELNFVFCKPFNISNADPKGAASFNVIR